MSRMPKITFASLKKITAPEIVVLVAKDMAIGTASQKILGETWEQIQNAAKTAEFSGKYNSFMEILAPMNNGASRIFVMGIGVTDDLTPQKWRTLGGALMGRLQLAKAKDVAIILETDDDSMESDLEAEVAVGLKLRAYKYDMHKTSIKNGKIDKEAEEKKNQQMLLHVHVDDIADAKKAFSDLDAVCEGTMLARTLVNEPANFLGPEEFAQKALELESLGIDVEVLEEADMEKLGMQALLGVGRGSPRPSKLAIMQWQGGSKKSKTVALVGKGVVFDTGGISLKPAGGMEDMKGDMGGAAAVIGTMQALATRNAKANVIGVLGLVENMPDGDAQRPGDIVTSLSGQTIEIINTDAEGRLVLADALWYTEDRFKPDVMIDLATLTGAIIVALGHEYAGLFSNDDKLADQLHKAGEESGEPVWRLPLGKGYDKLIDSKFADMKNTGGRWAGSTTAAQFLKRFVRKAKWAHLDVAGTAFTSKQSDTNKSWASGFGVELLNRFIADNYE